MNPRRTTTTLYTHHYSYGHHPLPLLTTSTPTVMSPSTQFSFSSASLDGHYFYTYLSRRPSSFYFVLRSLITLSLLLQDYLDVIRCPMDFSTIGQRLESGRYCPQGRCDEVDLSLFAADVRLVFRNAMTYNSSPLHPVC